MSDQVVDQAADPDRQAVAVRVNESRAHHTVHRAAEVLDPGSLVALEMEAVIDDLRRQRNDLFHGADTIGAVHQRTQTGGFGKQGVGALGKDHAVGFDVAVFAAGAPRR